MKIAVHLEFDTFGEAARIFEKLGASEAPHAPKSEHKPAVEPHKANGAHPTGAAPAAASTATSGTTSTAASLSEPAATGVTLEDVKASFSAYVGKAGGRTVATAKAILAHHGVPSGRFNDLRPEQWSVVKRALDTAGPEMPMGEAA